MLCPHCNERMPDEDATCSNCGAPLARDSSDSIPTDAEISGKAVLSLVFGLLGITCLWFLGGIVAITLGALAKRDIRRSGGRLRGNGLAVAGLIAGCCSFLFSVLPLIVVLAINSPGFREAQVVAKVARVRTDMRSMSVAIGAYFIDNNTYPAWAMGQKGPGGLPTYNARVAAYLGQTGDPTDLPSFALNGVANDQRFMTLTTPISYLSSYLTDRFSPVKGATFVYWAIVPGEPNPGGGIVAKSTPFTPSGWILISPGPDGDYDVPSDWNVYDPTLGRIPPRLLGGKNRKGSAFTYDPTNGTKSDGDIWVVK